MDKQRNNGFNNNQINIFLSRQHLSNQAQSKFSDAMSQTATNIRVAENKYWNEQAEIAEMIAFGLVPVGPIGGLVGKIGGRVINAIAKSGGKILIKAALKSGSSTIYRAVSKAELDDIAQFGFRTKAGGYETGKLFAPTLQEAIQFGKANFKFDGIPNTIIKVQVPNSVLNKAYKFGADGMNAISIPANQLNLLKGTPLNYSLFF